jgi:small subunit ribosomal protein S3
MGQKINPLGFRLGITKHSRSEWFSNHREYSQLLLEDWFLRKQILKNYNEAGITDIKINRKLNQIQLEIKTARPGIFLGKDGSRLEEIRKNLENYVQIFRKKNFYFYKTNSSFLHGKPEFAIHIIKLANPDIDANFIADFLVEQIQKRIPFRKAMKLALQKVQKNNVKGIKIQVSGRLNGAEIARSEWIREGRVPLQTLRAQIDYSYKTAKTIYGIIGIKIWIFKNDSELKN